MLTIYRSEASASLRRVPMWFVTSDGTSPATAESGGQPQICWHPRGTTTVNTSGTLSLVSANAGLYHVELTASEVSAAGMFSVHYRSATAVHNSAFGKIVNYDSADSVRLGLFAIPNAAANASGGLPQKGTTHSDFTVRIEGVAYSGATVGAGDFKPGVYSGVSFSVRDSGIATSSYQLGSYSGVSFEVKTGGIQTTSVGKGNYSGVSLEITTGGIQVASIGKGNYSGVSQEILAGGIQVASIGKGNYSGMSVEILSGGIQTTSVGAGNYSGMSVEIKNRGIHTNSIATATYSGVTFGIDNIKAASYSGVTVDGAMFLSTAGARSVASSLLSTSLGGTTPRLIQQSFELLRNKVSISGSTMTVFSADDATSSWTATISTGTATVYGVSPGIA